MIRLFPTLLVVLSSLFLSCTSPNNNEQLMYLGQVGFRRSYSGHEKLSQAELDSVEKSNPYYLNGFDSSDLKIIDILTQLEIANGEQLFLDKIAQDFKDTIVVVANDKENDTVFIKYDTSSSFRASIMLRNKKLLDSVSIQRGTLPDVFRLIDLKRKSNRYIVFLNQHYISNGENYEISVYQIK